MNPIALCTIAGVMIGVSTGVAFSGGAVNGAYVFGPIGFLLGFLLVKKGKKDNLSARSLGEKQYTEEKKKASFEESILEMYRGFRKICCIVWNLEMKLIKAIGLMPLFRKTGWSFVILAFLLLAVAFPLGMIFTVTGLVVVDDVAQEGDFMVTEY